MATQCFKRHNPIETGEAAIEFLFETRETAKSLFQYIVSWFGVVLGLFFWHRECSQNLHPFLERVNGRKTKRDGRVECTAPSDPLRGCRNLSCFRISKQLLECHLNYGDRLAVSTTAEDGETSFVASETTTLNGSRQRSRMALVLSLLRRTPLIS